MFRETIFNRAPKPMKTGRFSPQALQLAKKTRGRFRYAIQVLQSASGLSGAVLHRGPAEPRETSMRYDLDVLSQL